MDSAFNNKTNASEDAGTSEEASGSATLSGAPSASRDSWSRWNIVLISYASAVTLAFLYLLISGLVAQPHDLESLPDLPPVEEGQLSYVPPDAPLPQGHVVRLGEERRFGNVLVTPLRVSRDAVEFVHYSGDAAMSRTPVEGVLKLWLRFENASQDQQIAPLDEWLVFNRLPGNDLELLANNFVASQQDRSQMERTLLMYDLPRQGEWNLAEQNLDRVLQPGESETYYLASEPGPLDELADPLVWRVHFRKGYAASGNGVTTLIEVPFTWADVETERP